MPRAGAFEGQVRAGMGPWVLWLGLAGLSAIAAGYEWASYRALQARRGLRFLSCRDRQHLRMWRTVFTVAALAAAAGIVAAGLSYLLFA